MEKIKQMIENAQRIAVLGHDDEDNDSVGSTGAMTEMLRNMGKSADLYLSREPEFRIGFLLDDYIMADSINEMQEYDLAIVIDTSTKARIGKRISVFEKAKNTLVIDHHYTNEKYAGYNYVLGDMSSASEIVYDIICYMKEDITRHMAECLYCGIMGDTGCLKYSSASAKTAFVISKLMAKGIDHADLCRRMFDSEREETLKLKGYVMQNIERYFGGRLSLVAVDDEIFEKFGVSEHESGDIVDIPRSVIGTLIAVSVRKTADKIKISFRSNGECNVSDIAGKFGGGGHEKAAGAKLPLGDICEAKEKVIKAVGEYLDDRI